MSLFTIDQQHTNMFSLVETYKTFLKLNGSAVIVCNGQGVLESQTFKDVINLSGNIKNTIAGYIGQQNTCVGLLMNHNIYIPSIILSLMELNYAFIFVTDKTLDKNVDYLKLNWILSLDDVKEMNNFKETHRIALTNNRTLILWHRNDDVNSNVSYKNIFCVVQTSGSTGDNKIIRVPHDCIEINVSALRKLFGVTSKDVIFWGTPLTFDPSMVELLLALQTGASLVIVPYKTSVNPYSLYKALFVKGKITVLQTVPSVFFRWSENQIKDILNSSELRILAFGGENFPKCLLNYERSNNLRVFNLYGISEVSCWASALEIQKQTSDDAISIGQNLDETLLEVRDDKGIVISTGEGEIFIGSSTRICLLDKEKVCELNKPMFRATGDIAKIDETGVYLKGRKNKIIKRFGHRINLTKLDSMIFKTTGLQSTCIWSATNNKILTYILLKDIDVKVKTKYLDKIRAKLITALPEEAFPDFFEIVQAFPLTSHGKVDERNLEQLYSTQKTDTNIENGFEQLWCKYFGVSTDNLDEIRGYNFFEMGGTSIRALQFIGELEEIWDFKCAEELYRCIFNSTLKECLQYIKDVRPTKKRFIENVVKDLERKKGKIVDRGLEIIWSYDLNACVDGAPLVFEYKSLIYVSVGSFSHIFVVLNETGEIVHKLILPESVESKPTLMPNGRIVVGCFDGLMYCIDFLSKDVVWKYKTGGKIKGASCYWEASSAIIFGSYAGTLYCVTVDDGHLLWKTPLDGSVTSTPVYDNRSGKFFTATTAGTCFCIAEETGDIIWKHNCGGPVFGTPCIINSSQSIILPVVQGILLCMSTNGNILWKFDVKGHIFSSVVYYKDCIVFGSHDNHIYVAAVSLSNCDVIGKIRLESQISTTPYVCDINGEDVIVAACNSGIIYVIGFKSHRIMCRLQLAGQVFSAPFVYNSKIYVGCRDNKLHCIKVTFPEYG